jgi:hypothetical protein
MLAATSPSRWWAFHPMSSQAIATRLGLQQKFGKGRSVRRKNKWLLRNPERRFTPNLASKYYSLKIGILAICGGISEFGDFRELPQADPHN